MKFLIITSLIVASFCSILQVNKCLIDRCNKQLEECNFDSACQQTVTSCSENCSDRQCYENCLYSSNNSDQLIECGELNDCLASYNAVPCPSYCTQYIQGGADDCMETHKESPYPENTCIVDYLTKKNYNQCNDIQCVCSKASQLTVFVAGCYC
ncbi:hypothetical protein pb186bvf_011300 [Paramecium bursaria]